MVTEEITVSTNGRPSTDNIKVINFDKLTGVKYKKILHSVQLEGMIIDTETKDDDEYISEAAIEQGPPATDIHKGGRR